MTDASARWTPFRPDSPPQLSEGPGRIVVLVETDRARAEGWGSETAVALARAWRARDARLVLVDLSLADPTLHEQLGAENDEGVADAVLYGASVRRVTRRVGGLHFIAAGTAVADPAELMTSPRWARMCDGFLEAGVTMVGLVPASGTGAAAVLGRATDTVVIGAQDEALPALALGGVLRAVTGPEPEAPAPEPVPEQLPLEEPPAEEPALEPPTTVADAGEAEAAPFEAEAEPLEVAAEPPDAEEGPLDGLPLLEIPDDSDTVGLLEGIEPTEPAAELPEEDGPLDLGEPLLAADELLEVPAPAGTEGPLPEVEEQPAVPAEAPEGPPVPTVDEILADEPGRPAVPTADEILAEAGEAPPPHTPEAVVARLDRADERPSRRRNVLLLVLLLLVVSVAAAWYLGYLPLPPVLERFGLGPDVTTEGTTEVPGDPVSEPPVEVSSPAAYSMQVAAYPDRERAWARASELARVAPEGLWIVAPVSVDGDVYHRILLGPAADEAGARALAQAVASAAGGGADSWLVRQTPLAFVLGEMGDLDTAARRVQALADMEVPAYLLAVAYSDGSTRYRAYAGAFADADEASYLRGLLEERGLSSATLTDRRGRLPE